MTELQRRVLVEAEFLFYLATSPSMFSLPNRGDVHLLVSRVSTSELVRVNAQARARLREGPLALGPPIPIKESAVTPALSAGGDAR